MRGNKALVFVLAVLALLAFGAAGCDTAKDLLKSEITGKVIDSKGQPVEGATIKLFDLTANTDFVSGGDINSAEGQIDPAKVANSDNTVATATTGADGTFTMSDVSASAFLATASKENCTVDFQGFDDETGVLNQDTLLIPTVDEGGLAFEIPQFTIACADPPENVKEDGSAEGTEEPEPQPEPSCDETECAALNGFCADTVCIVPVCSETVACEGEAICVNGGTAEAECVLPACSETMVCEDGLLCENPGTLEALCVKPVCTVDDDCMGEELCYEPNTLNAVCIQPVCSETIACPDTLLCHEPGTLEAVCLPPVCTESGNECGDGNVCTDPGTLDAACATPVCSANEDCTDNKVCENAGTANAQCVDAVCYADADCGEGLLCKDGGTLLATCLPPVCTEDADCGEGQFCVNGGTLDATCVTPACATNDDCTTPQVCVNAALVDAYCADPACVTDDDCVDGVCGANAETGLPECQAMDPNEIIPPDAPDPTWTSFKVMDASGAELADASTDNQTVSEAVANANAIVRVSGSYTGEETVAYVMIQTGSIECGDGFEPKIDYIEVPIIDGKINGGKGDFLEVYLYGGYMKVQLSTSNINGEGERSSVVEFGTTCMQPENPLTVILSWNVPADNPAARADIDLHAWNAAGEQVYYGSKVKSWGQLDVDDRRGPGPEVFTVTPDGSTVGPVTWVRRRASR
jgi:hypothetical protein